MLRVPLHQLDPGLAPPSYARPGDAGADLTARAFLGARLFPFAAPIGGSLTILSWLAVAIVFAFGADAKRALK